MGQMFEFKKFASACLYFHKFSIQIKDCAKTNSLKAAPLPMFKRYFDTIVVVHSHLPL